MRAALLSAFILVFAHAFSQTDSLRAIKDTAVKTKTLEAVTVASKKPFVQQRQGKTIINPEALISNAGTSVLEVLEKSPGVMVDRNGGISLRGKASVMVMIDDKPSYLSGKQLEEYLNGMSSTQVDQIELITNPSAKYDAAGNAGIINIKLKKNKQKGFNGNAGINYGQGRYYKSNQNISLNYRNGKINTYLTHSFSANTNYMTIFADRSYFGNNPPSFLDYTNTQIFRGRNNSSKAGVDYFVSDKTSIGVGFTGSYGSRKARSYANTNWLDADGKADSALSTYGYTDLRYRNTSFNLNLRHRLDSKSDLGVDADRIFYRSDNDQFFENKLLFPNTYTDGSRSALPSTLDIYSAKADYTRKLKNGKLEAGYKTSRIETDNIADYEALAAGMWSPDYAKTNHFLYNESINALYASTEGSFSKFSFQAGLRYEHTAYDGKQLGNPLRKDSSFNNTYSGLFPTGYFSWKVDSSNVLTVTAGRRLDRPYFQKLNPFVFIINKYTYQSGNPYIRPQYSWNMEVSHTYKDFLTTALSLSITKNYFSQIFLNGADDIIIYTDGNVGRVYNFGVSVSVQRQLAKWWTLNAQSQFNYKELKGFPGDNRVSATGQLHTNMNNQFKLSKTVSAELSGYYTTRARNDLKELLYPTGQLTVAVAKQILKGKGTARLSARDIFHTQAMEGFTDFPGANEYFILYRDTRVLNLGITYRFGKPLKTAKKSSGSAEEETQRAG